MVELRFSMRAFVSYRACLRRIHDEDPEFFTRLVKQQILRIGCSDRRVPANGTLAQLALAWCFKNPNVSSVITGASHPSQVIENMKALDVVPEMLSRVNAYLARKGLLLKRGSGVDVTIIAVPSSSKNAEGERDPEMHQTRKGNQWHFGMNAHIGADADSGLVHPITVTPANEADVEQIEELLHGKEEVVHADAGYSGAQTRVERQGLRWKIAAKPGRIKAMKEGRNKRALERIEKRRASIRAKVKHPFRVIKRLFDC